MKKLELYIHIPFCVRKCAYCDFLSAPAGRETQEQYFRALKQEILEFPQVYKEEYTVVSVFFGGGTPSIVPAEWIAEVMELLREEFRFSCDGMEEAAGYGQPEISLECNPGTADEEKFRIYRAAGINRISFGLQSADNRELKLLGRIHSWEEFVHTYEAARKAGFENINIDLMSALPGQTVQSWEDTLHKVLALKPEHISAYSLIIEEGTPFYEAYEEDAEKRERGEQPDLLPSEDEERQMYERTEEVLQAAGMHRYEISNYARNGFECRHNIGYWDGTEYAGFGLGASSMLCKEQQNESREDQPRYQRIRNTEDLSAYLRYDFSEKEIETLTLEDRMAEFMFMGLRMMNGVSETEFLFRFGKDVEEVYGDVLCKQKALGLLAQENGRIFLTVRGIDVSNMVMAEFLL